MQLNFVPYMLQTIWLECSAAIVVLSVDSLLALLKVDKAEYELLKTFHRSFTSPDASLITVPPTINAMKMYEIVVRRIASNVPLGIAVCGSY